MPTACDNISIDYLAVGPLTENNGETREVAIYVQSLVRIVDLETNLPLSSDFMKGITSLEAIKYREEI